MIELLKELFFKTFACYPDKIEKMQAHGSKRLYFRLFCKEKTCIGAYNEDRKENEAFIDYAMQMKAKGIGVPNIYAYDVNSNIYLQEDLGEVTFFDFFALHSLQESIAVYKKILSHLIEIQLMPDFDYTKSYPRKSFDKQSIMWDFNYFKYCFLKVVDIEFDEQLLENDFNALADYLLMAPKDYFLYRDFQSRNIMLHNDKIYFIDFQGGRKGALQYDVASLLFDGKVNLTWQEKTILLDYYISLLSKKIEINTEQFTNYFYAFAYARIMQAMGAYGYRGIIQNKTSFSQSISRAMNNLKALQENKVMPIELKELDKVFASIINSKKLKELSQTKKLTLTIKSFSYKKAYPMDVSGNGGGFVFDCRALPNPGRLEEFKHLNGKDKEVVDYLKDKEEVKNFMNNVTKIVAQSVDNYLQRGFGNLMVCFGCTGGQHRSVFCAEELSKVFSQNTDLKIITQHIEQNI
ncbi:MAG: RNase adapter RapZ [Bacteroidota bacterium]|nr:RNase adapter RapZ [Bacteroidota bacterium]